MTETPDTTSNLTFAVDPARLNTGHGASRQTRTSAKATSPPHTAPTASECSSPSGHRSSGRQRAGFASDGNISTA